MKINKILMSIVRAIPSSLFDYRFLYKKKKCEKHFFVVDKTKARNSIKLFKIGQTKTVHVLYLCVTSNRRKMCQKNKQILLSVNYMKNYFVMLDLLCLSN